MHASWHNSRVGKRRAWLVGARMLADVEEAWARQGIQLRLADAHADVRDMLRAEGLEARVSRIDRRTSVEDIVAAFRPVS